ncbi:hypothetical protein E3N88_37856 [Mikania micrantha]|uniref:Uncharacterized protein n=1 Tax=Mikania micrantha TaxID=192012 RepID=A0A5N6LSD3_9ASTR|nr:hypothetical protein E3N88_37856 [Mikania micrantha]
MADDSDDGGDSGRSSDSGNNSVRKGETWIRDISKILHKLTDPNRGKFLLKNMAEDEEIPKIVKEHESEDNESSHNGGDVTGILKEETRKQISEEVAKAFEVTIPHFLEKMRTIIQQELSKDLNEQMVLVNVSMRSDCQAPVWSSNQIVNLGETPFMFSKSHNKFIVEGYGTATVDLCSQGVRRFALSNLTSIECSRKKCMSMKLSRCGALWMCRRPKPGRTKGQRRAAIEPSRGAKRSRRRAALPEPGRVNAT